MTPRRRLGAAQVDAWITAMAADLALQREARGLADWEFIGIHTGGVWVAQRLTKLLGHERPLGVLNIAFYRDDFSRIGKHPTVTPSHLPFEVEGRHVVLVDDILYTGRTVRAAMNEIFDYGRPASITLAVLADRGGRELPIEAAVCGGRLDPGAGGELKLTGPEPLDILFQARD